MLTFENDSHIRIRSGRECVVWLIMCVVMSVLLAVEAYLVCFYSAVKVYVAEGTWWVYGETSRQGLPTTLGAAFLRFVSEDIWEMELVPGYMFAEDEGNNGNKWCTGYYKFVEKGSTWVLQIKIDDTLPDYEDGVSEVDPSGVKLIDSDGNEIQNGEWVEFYPNEQGYFVVEIRLTAEVAALFLPAANRTFTFTFGLPSADSVPGYYLDEENEYYESLYGKVAFSEERVAATKAVA